MCKIKNKKNILAIALLSLVTSVSFAMNRQEGFYRKEQENIITLFQNFRNADLHWKYFSTEHIQQLFKKVPFNAQFLENLYRANTLEYVVERNITDMFGKDAMTACIEYCKSKLVIAKIVAIYCQRCYYWRNHGTRRQLNVPTRFENILHLAGEKNPIVYQHLIRRTQILTSLQESLLPCDILTYYIMPFIDTSCIASKYEKQDREERKEYLEKNYSDFKINFIDGKKIAATKLFLL